MRSISYQEIMSATKPEQIFSMRPARLQAEFDELCGRFSRDEKGHEIQNFVATQQLKLMFQRAQSIIASGKDTAFQAGSRITLISTNGERIEFDYLYHVSQRVCDTYSNDSGILMVVDAKFEDLGLFSNYVEKVLKFTSYWKGKREWDSMLKYSAPNIIQSFRTQDKKSFVIILQKPGRIYPLRQVLDFFDGRMDVRHVMSIVKRLYAEASFIDIAGLHHNAICVDNLYFAPGRETQPGQKYEFEDLRIVGLYGGWFFTSSSNEKIVTFPQEIRDIVPPVVEKSRFSSFEVDMLSIKKVARELLGDVSGRNLYNVHSKLCDWFTRERCERNAYEEWNEFEFICKEVFGAPEFANMDLPI